MSDILAEIREFQAATGLGDHRTGIILANNGRLLDRLEAGRRIWPDTEAEIRAALARECVNRGLHTCKRGAPAEPIQPPTGSEG